MPDLSFAVKAEDQTGEGISKVKRDLDEAGNAAEGAGGKFGGLANHLGAVATAAIGIGGIFEGGKFLSESVDAAESLAQSVSKVQRTIGGTTEDASRLKFALGESIGAVGGNADNATMALGRFSKGLSGLIENEDGTTTKSSALTKQLEEMGIKTQNAAGQALPMTNVLGQLADKFQAMPDGAQKTALAMQLFGRQGVDLIPFLDKGSAGIAQLEGESDKLGLTLSQNTIQQTQKLTAAQMQLHEAGEGLKVQLGAALLPLLADGAVRAADWATAFDEKVLPAVTRVATFLSGDLSRGFHDVMDVIAPYGDAIDAIFGKIGGLLDRVGGQAKSGGEALVSAIGGMIPGFGAVSALIPGVTAKLAEWGQVILDKIMPVLKDLLLWLQEKLQVVWVWLIGNLPIVINWFKQIGEQIGGAVMIALKTFGDLLMNVIVPTIKEWVSQLAEKLQPAIAAVTGFLHDHETAVKNVGIALVALLAPIVAIIGAIVLVRQHWDDISQQLQALRPILDAIGQAFQQLGSAILKEMQPVIDWFRQQFMPEFTADAGAIAALFTQKIIPAIQAVIDFIREHWAQISSLFQGPLEIVKAVVQGTFDTLRVIIEGAMRIIGDLIIAAMALIHGDWQTAWDKVKDIPVAIFDTLKGLVSVALTELEGVLRGAWDTVKAQAELGWQLLQTAVDTALTNLGALIKALPGEIVGWLGDLGSLLYQAGVDLIQGLINGVESMASKVTGAMGDLAGKAKKAFTDPLSIFSPSKVMEEVGRDITAGLAAGIAAGASSVLDAMSQLATGVVGQANAMSRGAGGAGGGGSTAGGGFGAGFGGLGTGVNGGGSIPLGAGGKGVLGIDPSTGDMIIDPSQYTPAQLALFHGYNQGTVSAAQLAAAGLPVPSQYTGPRGGSGGGGGGSTAGGGGGGFGAAGPASGGSGGGGVGGATDFSKINYVNVGIANGPQMQGYQGAGAGVAGGTFAYRQLAARWNLEHDPRYAGMLDGSEAGAQRAVEAFVGGGTNSSGPNWSAAIPLPTAAQTALASQTAPVALPPSAGAGGGLAPTFVFNISALDAPSFQAYLPTLIRQIDLGLKQNGQTGILK